MEQTVSLYNYLKLHTVPEEYNLIEHEIKDLDSSLEAAEKSLNWNSENIWDYIENIRKTTDDLNSRLRKAQDNVLKINKEIRAWENVPLFERINDPKMEPLLNTKDVEENKKKIWFINIFRISSPNNGAIIKFYSESNKVLMQSFM